MILRTLAATVALLALTATAAQADPSATIRRTEHGIPHIIAERLRRASATATATRSPRTTSASIADTLRDGARRALALLRARRGATSFRGQRLDGQQPQLATSSSSRSSTTRRSRSCSRSRRRTGPRARDHARRCAATSPATTASSRDTGGRPTCPTRPAGASRGCTPISEIDAYRRFYQLALLASSAAWRSTASAARSRRRPRRR